MIVYWLLRINSHGTKYTIEYARVKAILINSFISKESIKIVSPEDTVCFTEDPTGCSEVKIDNGRLIVDVPANSGMVIALR